MLVSRKYFEPDDMPPLLRTPATATALLYFPPSVAAAALAANLVCPAGYDLGEDLKVVIVSTTEGDDKPLKYPAMFRNASALIINKIDLIPYVNCLPALIEKNAHSINPSLKIFKTSCTTGEGIAEWCGWIESKIKK